MVVFGVWFVDGCTRLHMENYLSVDFVFLIVVGWLFIFGARVVFQMDYSYVDIQ